MRKAKEKWRPTLRAKPRREDEVPIGEEFAGARLEDKRRTRRLVSIAEAINAAPRRSLPEIAETPAALEALYRFMNTKKIDLTLDRVLEPHADRARERTSGRTTVLAIHDGSDLAFAFDGVLREGFGRLGNQQGIQALVSLAVAFSEDGESMTLNDDHEPLGVLACQTWAGSRVATRVTKSRKKRPTTTPKRTGTRWGRITGAEWLASIAKSREAAGPETPLIHVIDREADGLELYATMQQNRERFVIRANRNRNVRLLEDGIDEFEKFEEAAARLPRCFEEAIHVAKRGHTAPHQRNPPRAARLAHLTYAAGHIQIKKSWELGHDDSVPTFLTLNLVHVKERDAPQDEEPIEWFLITSEPIATESDVRRVVRIYRARWLIEEFFKALKTGCAIEKRQVESRQALEGILAISLVVAWRLLFLRHKSRIDAEAPPSVAFTELELDLMHRMWRLKSGANLQDALLLVAQRGGHLKSNGSPGPVVLARGLEKLEIQAEVWAFAMAKK